MIRNPNALKTILVSSLLIAVSTACSSEKADYAPSTSVDTQTATDESSVDTVDGAEAASSDTPTTSIANPWVVSDKDGVYQATGFSLDTYDGATDIVYSYTTDGKLAQVRYTVGNNEWTYRVEATDGLEDISGMYYEWDSDEKETLGGHDAQYLAYSEASEDTEFIDDVFAVHVVNWYDEAEGATHSLSVAGKDINGLDLEIVAENMMK